MSSAGRPTRLGASGALRSLPAVVALAMLVAAVFLPVAGFGFVKMDVLEQVLENPYIRSLSIENVKHICTSWCIQSYYPIRTLSYAVDYQLWGLLPGGFKLTNVLIHLANVFLVYGLVLRLLYRSRPESIRTRSASEAGKLFPRLRFGLVYDASNSTGSGLEQESTPDRADPGPRNTRLAAFSAAFSAAVFAVHPVVVEPVAWVAGREELLMTLGALGCFHFHLTGRRLGERNGRRAAAAAWHLGAAAACAFACLSNAVAAVIPLLITAFDALMLPPPKTRRIAAGTAALWLIGVTTIVIKRLGYRSDTSELSSPFTGEWLTVIAETYWRNIESLFWPFDLIIFYDWRFSEGWMQADVILGTAAIAVTLGLLWRLRRRKLVVFGVIWFGLALSPAAQMIPHHIPRADRFLYLPLVGLAIAVGAGLEPLGRRFSGPVARPGAIAVGILLLSFLALRSADQLRFWKDDLAVWRHCVTVEPENPTAHCCVANCLVARNRFGEAIPHYYMSLHLYPDHKDALNNFALHLAAGKVTELHDYELALSLAKRGFEITDGNDPKLRHTLAVAHASAASNMNRKGEFQQAVDQYYEAIEIDPDYDVPVFNLALLLATCSDEKLRRPEEAVRLAEDGRRLLKDPAPHRMTILAGAYASANRMDAAIATIQNALKLVRSAGTREQIHELTEQLTVYRRRKAGIPADD